ncbi:MAG: hypothetical protein IT314_17005 [Anaerolineales bacterium]|nr:hypothetical protein [Anaerolineales bacterium]
MVKAGLISGAVMFVLVLVVALFVPVCALCIPLVTGLAAGYMTGMFEKMPATSVKNGAIAGAIAGGLGLVGQMLASVINAAVMQNPNNQLNQLFGVPASTPSEIWTAQLGIACCFGLINVALTAGFGAGGGAIWNNTAGKSTPPSDMTPAS